MPTIGSITFSSSDELTGDDGDTITKTANIDFANVTFTSVGIYRYKITETIAAGENGTSAVTKANIDNNGDEVRYLDVYVGNDDNGGCKILYTVMLNGDVEVTGTSGTNGWQYSYNANNKTDSFSTDTYNTYELKVTKEIAGSMGDKSAEFPFIVVITGLDAGTIVKYALNDANSTSVNATADNDGKVTINNVSLGHNSELTISGIPASSTGADVKYSVSESLTGKDDYVATYKVNDANEVESSSVDNQEKHANTDTVAYTNTKEAATPTGLLMDVAPYAAMIVLAAAAAFVFLRRRSANED